MSPYPTSEEPRSVDHGFLHALKQRSFTHSSDLYNESERLKTFCGWPSKAVTAKDLASNGFYFTGQEDVARCAFCGLEVGQWENGDSVINDHKRYAPDCDFVRGRPCPNVPQGSSSSNTSPEPAGYDTCGPHGHLIRLFSGPERSTLPPTLLQDLEQLGVTKTSGPDNPGFASKEGRLRTFVSWPESCPARPEALAEAGFYSTGNADHALCFHCGGGLKDWEAGDDPWVEHARWFSKCSFVHMNKGPEFVASVALSKPAVLPVEAMSGLLEKKQTCEEKPCEDVAGPSMSEKPSPALACEVPKPLEPPMDTYVAEEKTLRDMEMCKICYNKERAIVFLPCGHFVSCAPCASALSTCPVCRQPLKATVRAYLS